MALKEKITARLKVKAAGVNLSKERIEVIVKRAEKGLTDESDDTAIDANLDTINELSPFKEMAAHDDYLRAKTKKEAEDKEAARLKAIEEGKTPEPELPADTPEWMKAFMTAQAAQNKAMQDQIAAINVEKVTNTRRESFIQSMKGTTPEYQARELKKFDRITFKDDTDFNSFLEETKGDHAAAIQDDSNAGLGNDRPTSGTGMPKTGEKEVSPAMKELIAERKAKADLQAAKTV